VKESESSNHIYTGKSIAKNTIYNLLGYGIPLLFAVVLIPLLIKGLGTERFGILNLAWIVIGYFSFFDFGIGRALTKIIAEKIGTSQTEEIPVIFWTSFFLMLFASIIGTILLLFITPVLVYKFFNISYSLQTESLKTFYLLALSVPIVTTTAGIRGFLEAYQKFWIINVIRTFLGVFSFLGPLLCLFFTTSLFWVVLFLIFVRLVVWLFYLLECFKLNNKLKQKLFFDYNLIKPILKLSGWITVSNIIVPIIVYLDRFLIGALVSATAIAYYATPYEVISKLLLIPGALTVVLFPAFSANYINQPDFTRKLTAKATKYIFLLMYPIVLIIITFANDGLSVWLGNKFAENSTLILQLLAAGALINSLAYIPFTFLQGIGRPDITAIVNLVELPVYLLAMWFTIKYKGINGAAFVWLLRMIVDAFVLFSFEQKCINGKFGFKYKLNYLFVFILFVISVLPIILTYNILLKIILTPLILFAFLALSWKYFLSEEEKMFLVSRLKILNQKTILENKTAETDIL
jgi:O-antigen/teichoic acid export membrane protein